MSVVSSYSSSSYLPSQSRLSLAGQSLSSLPEDLEEGIEELNLAQNRLSPLPATLVSLAGLRKLDVSDNGLLELPEELCQLQRLEVLIVKRNSLKSLPDSFAQLGSSLRELNTSGNLLEKFPPQIVCLTKLESPAPGWKQTADCAAIHRPAQRVSRGKNVFSARYARHTAIRYIEVKIFTSFAAEQLYQVAMEPVVWLYPTSQHRCMYISLCGGP